MLQEKTTKELKELLSSLTSKLGKMNSEVSLEEFYFSETDIAILKSDAPEIEKKKWVISKILQVRIALFKEFSRMIDHSEKNHDLDKAVEYMNEYIFSLAVPFIGNMKPPSKFDRLRAFFNKNTVPSPYEYMQKWKTEYQMWFQNSKLALPERHEAQKQDKYREMHLTFDMLYAYSFSRDNVPERRAFVIVDPNKVKIA
jgi:hypothetical protein